MRLKRFVSVICTVALLASQGSFSVYSVGDAENMPPSYQQKEEKKEVAIFDKEKSFELETTDALSEFLKNNITVHDKEYNRINTAVFEFSDNVALSGILENEDVILTATAVFDSQEAGAEKNVILSDFRLSGNDADKYSLSVPENFTLEIPDAAEIYSKKIFFYPVTDSYTYKDIYSDLDYRFDENDIFEGDSITPDIILKLVYSSKDKKYVYQYSAMTNNPNYIFEFVPDKEPQVDDTAYKETVVVLDEPEQENANLIQTEQAIYANGNIRIILKAVSAHKLDHGMTFELYSNKISVGDPVTVTEPVKKENYYEYDAEYFVSVNDENNGKLANLQCHFKDEDEIEYKTEDLFVRASNSENYVNTVVLDTVPPSAYNIKAEYNIQDNDNFKNVKVSGKMNDNLSGIQKVEYLWDNDTEYSDQNVILNVEKGTFEFIFPYKNFKKAGGQHLVQVRITDNSRNTYLSKKEAYSGENVGMDTKPPILESVTVRVNNEQDLSYVLDRISDQNKYFNKYFDVVIKAKDKSESKQIADIAKVEFQANGADTVSLDKTADNIYTYSINKDQAISQLSVRLTDAYGNRSGWIKLSGYQIDDRNISFPSEIVTDTQAPDIKFENALGLYGISGGKIIVNVSDVNLKNVDISDDSDSIRKSSGQLSNSKEYQYEIKTENLLTGDYAVTVSAEDYAGNSIKKILKFSVDKELPQGRLEMFSHHVVVRNGKNWIKEISQEHQIAPVIMRLYPKKTGSKLKSFIFKVNSRDFYPETEMKQDENGEDFIEFEVPVSSEINSYQVGVDIISEAGNCQSVLYNCNIDRNTPVIKKFEVFDTKDEWSRFVYLVSFGIFYNDDIGLRVEVEDDSEVEKVLLNYNSPGLPILMEKKVYNGKTCYECSIPKNTQIFKQHVSVTAYDIVGRYTSELPNTQNTDPDNRKEFATNFVMIENVDPVISISMPQADHTNGNSVWFDGKDRNISVKVQDTDSGIRQADIYLNGKKLKTDKNGKKVIDVDVTSQSGHPITAEQEYIFSVNDIADDEQGNYKLTVVVTDNAGNTVQNNSTSFFRDTTPPEITGFYFEEVLDSETNEKKKSGNTKELNDPFDEEKNIIKTDYGYYFQRNFKIKVYAQDENASSGLNRAVIYCIPYNDDGTFGEAVSASLEINDYESEYFEIEKGYKGIIYAYVTDNTGNVSSKQTARAYVSEDQTPDILIEELPETVIEDFEKRKLYTDNISFGVTIRDTGSGLKNISYQISSDTVVNSDSVATKTDENKTYSIGDDMGNGWIIKKMDLNIITEAEKIFTFGKDDDRNIFIELTAEDNSGNTNNIESEHFTIDRMSPAVSYLELIAEDGHTKKVLTSNILEYEYYYNSPVTLIAHCEDKEPSSGLYSVDFQMDSYIGNDKTGESIQNVQIDGTTASIRIPVGFKGQIHITPYDNTKNTLKNAQTVSSLGFSIEQNNPEINISEMTVPKDDKDDNENLLYDHHNVQFKVTVRDTESGLDTISYSKSADISSDKEKTLTIKNNGYQVGDILEDSGWKITGMDHNIVTEISRIFIFDQDDKNIFMTFSASDKAGNSSDSTESQHFTIDTVSPTVTDISFSAKTYDDISKVDQKDFIENLEYGYYFKESFELTVSCNDSKPSSGLKNIAFLFVPYENGQQISKEEYSKPQVKDAVTVQKATVVNGKASCTVDKGFKGQIFVTAYDYAANASKTITTQAYVVEDESPEITIAPLPYSNMSDDEGNKLYNRRNISFKVTVTDTKSGIRSITHSKLSEQIDKLSEIKSEFGNTGYDADLNKATINGWIIEETDQNLVTKVSQIFTFDKDEKNIFMNFSATDRSGNISKTKQSEHFTIDTASPNILRFNFMPASVDNIDEVDQDELYRYIKEKIEEFDYGYYFREDFDATVTVSDQMPSSGLNKVVFHLMRYENQEWQEEERHTVDVNSEKKATFKIDNGFKGQIFAQVYDNAQNTSFEERPDAFVIDNDKPNINIEKLVPDSNLKDGNNNQLYTDSVKFRVTITDTVSGLRQITYSPDSENIDKNANTVTTSISNKDTDNYAPGKSIGNGWIIEKMDKNIVTQVSQEFTFIDDDNDIILDFSAKDRSNNENKNVQSIKFTIDKTPPKVIITYPEMKNGNYYQTSATFMISITERNFSQNLMEFSYPNSYLPNVKPQIQYSKDSNNHHTYTVVFTEGDYEFTFIGKDMADHATEIVYQEGDKKVNDMNLMSFSRVFKVDGTKPAVTTNFEDGSNSNTFKNDYFNAKTVTEQKFSVSVSDHNLSKDNIKLYVSLYYQKKMSGKTHSDSEMSDWIPVTLEWDLKEDIFSASVDLDSETNNMKKFSDGVYRFKLTATDPAGNSINEIESMIFEIDRQAPKFVSRTGLETTSYRDENFNNHYIEFYSQSDINNYKKSHQDKEPAPSLKFDDINFKNIEIKYEIHKPDYKDDDSNEYINIISDSGKIQNHTSDYFEISDFKYDGAYIYKFDVYDKAGNKCSVEGTYFRMTRCEMLAYIAESKIDNITGERTGYFLFTDDEGHAISKKMTDISDITVNIIAPRERKDNINITVSNSPDTGDYIDELEEKDLSETAVSFTWVLRKDYFNTFFKDASINDEFDIKVGDGSVLWRLATLHIDNEPPTGTLPSWFKSWGNNGLDDEIEVTITSINETLDINTIFDAENFDENKTCILDFQNGKTIIPYVYNENDKTITFTLDSGFHDIDIVLVDKAGNKSSSNVFGRINNFIVGKFLLYLGISIGCVVVLAIIIIIFIRIKKRK